MSEDRKCFILRYSTGEQMQKGDKVIINSQLVAVVEEVLEPNTPLACDYYVEDTGGFLLRYDDGQFEVWTHVEQEITFLERGV